MESIPSADTNSDSDTNSIDTGIGTIGIVDQSELKLSLHLSQFQYLDKQNEYQLRTEHYSQGNQKKFHQY